MNADNIECNNFRAAYAGFRKRYKASVNLAPENEIMSLATWIAIIAYSRGVSRDKIEEFAQVMKEGIIDYYMVMDRNGKKRQAKE